MVLGEHGSPMTPPSYIGNHLVPLESLYFDYLYVTKKNIFYLFFISFYFLFVFISSYHSYHHVSSSSGDTSLEISLQSVPCRL